VRGQQRAVGGDWRWVRGAHGTTLTVTVSKPAEYRAVFTNSEGTATSQDATVSPTPVAPKIVDQPRDADVRAGKVARFTVKVSGQPAPTLQWFEQRAGSHTWTAVPGGTGSTLTVTGTSARDGARYRAVATNVAGSVTSRTVTLEVTGR
jgi:hypothetical protein